MIAVYVMTNEQAEVIYVGFSITAADRLSSHRDKPWFEEVRRIDLHWYPTPEEAIEAEQAMIDGYRPRYNTAGVATPYVAPNLNRAPSRSKEVRRRRRVVNRTIGYLPAERVKWYRDRMTEELMRTYEKKDVMLQRRLGLMMFDGLFRRMYDEAVEAEFTATGVRMREREVNSGDWDDVP